MVRRAIEEKWGREMREFSPQEAERRMLKDMPGYQGAFNRLHYRFFPVASNPVLEWIASEAEDHGTSPGGHRQGVRNPRRGDDAADRAQARRRCVRNAGRPRLDRAPGARSAGERYIAGDEGAHRAENDPGSHCPAS